MLERTKIAFDCVSLKAWETKVYLLVSYTAVSLLLSGWLLNQEETDIFAWTKLCSITALCLFICQSIIMRMLKIKVLSLEFVFVVLIYVFYLGQAFLISINYNFGDMDFSLAYVTYGVTSYIKSTKYSLCCIAFVFLGLMIGSKSAHQKRLLGSKDQRSILDNYQEKTTVWIMFLVSAPFELYSLFSKLYIMSTSTYLDAHATGGGILVEFMSALFFASIMFFLMNLSENPVKCKILFFIIIAYEAITMLTGQRAMGIIKIFLCIFVYYYAGNKKMDLRTGVVLIIGIMTASYALVIIRNSRANGLSLASLDFSSNGFLPFDVLSEFGITGKTVTNALVKTKELAGGKSLLCSFLAIIPGWSNLFGDNLIERYYTYLALDQQAWGSSFISDYYFDFGFIGGIIASCIYAYIVGRCFSRFVLLMQKHMYAKASCYAYFTLQFIYTIRSYVFRLPRYFVYFMIIRWICSIIANSLVSRNVFKTIRA